MEMRYTQLHQNEGEEVLWQQTGKHAWMLRNINQDVQADQQMLEHLRPGLVLQKRRFKLCIQPEVLWVLAQAH